MKWAPTAERIARWYTLDDPPADERAEARLIEARAHLQDRLLAASWERLLSRGTVLESEADRESRAGVEVEG